MPVLAPPPPTRSRQPQSTPRPSVPLQQAVWQLRARWERVIDRDGRVRLVRRWAPELV
jgi:hypothetical protein